MPAHARKIFSKICGKSASSGSSEMQREYPAITGEGLKNLAYTFHETVYSIFVHYMRTVQLNFRNLKIGKGFNFFFASFESGVGGLTVTTRAGMEIDGYKI